jgi:hypothetical protein
VSPLNRIGVLRAPPRRRLPFLAFAARTSGLRPTSSRLLQRWAHASTHIRSCPCSSTVTTPARWLYQPTPTSPPRHPSPVGLVLWRSSPFLGAGTRRAAARADAYLANATVVRTGSGPPTTRADVVFPAVRRRPEPPVPSHRRRRRLAADGFHLVVSGAAVQERAPRVEAFRGLRTAPHHSATAMEGELRRRAPATAAWSPALDDAQMRLAYATPPARRAQSHEDFGLTPLEAGAFGRPTLALHAAATSKKNHPGRSTHVLLTTPSAGDPGRQRWRTGRRLDAVRSSPIPPLRRVPFHAEMQRASPSC